MVSVVGLTPEMADFADAVWGYALRALKHGSTDTEQSLRRSVASGDAQLWAASRDGVVVGGFVTEILDRPTGRYCVVVVAGGEAITPAGCAEAIEQITPWARSLGCNQFEINGRNGWARHLKDKRWRQAHVTYRREV